MRTIAVAAAALAVLLSSALADEVWDTSFGEVEYEADINGVAVFSYPIGDGAGRFYIPGLAGNLESRGSYLGYWIAPGDGGCPAEMTGADGTTSRNWGQLLVAFHAPAFPSGWTMVTGTCFGPALNSFIGTPDLGEPEAAAEEPAPKTGTKAPPPPPPAN